MSNRSLGAQSLLPNPILQKTSLIPPGAQQSRASNISSVRYADEEGKPLSEKDKDKDKGKGKGAGTRLLTVSGHGGGWAVDGRVGDGDGAGGALGTGNPETTSPRPPVHLKGGDTRDLRQLLNFLSLILSTSI